MWTKELIMKYTHQPSGFIMTFGLFRLCGCYCSVVESLSVTAGLPVLKTEKLRIAPDVAPTTCERLCVNAHRS